MAFEQGRLKFEAPKKMMEIDGHPFATNMVDVARDEGSPQIKAADDVKGKGPMKDIERSSAPRRCVTSQMLLNKFQHDRERRQRREEEE
jgi:hypothetical protein